jgi:hypothetical protein
MFFTLLLALLSMLESSRTNAWIFGLVALACLAVASYPPRPGRQ